MTTPLTASTLADVYAIDFGRRDADRGTWRDVLGREAARRESALDVVEVGVGDGRVPAMVIGHVPINRWLGIDPSPAMLAQFERRPFVGQVATLACLGDAADPHIWAAIARTPGVLDVALCAYSTMFLLPPKRQAALLRHMAYAVRPGGLLVVECFVPTWVESGDHVVFGACGNPDGDDATWGRVAQFSVDAVAGRTIVNRTYGPIVARSTPLMQRTATTRNPSLDVSGVEPRFEVREEVWWHHPPALRDLALDAGWLDARIVQGPPVAPGYFLLVGRT